MDEFEVAVFTGRPVDGRVRGGRRRRRLSPDLSYGWHLMQAERPLTWCGIEFSYAYSRRRLWSETPEEQRCESCLERRQRVSRTDTRRMAAPIAAGMEKDPA
jgi:hypothetical protein